MSVHHPPVQHATSSEHRWYAGNDARHSMDVLTEGEAWAFLQRSHACLSRYIDFYNFYYIEHHSDEHTSTPDRIQVRDPANIDLISALDKWTLYPEDLHEHWNTYRQEMLTLALRCSFEGLKALRDEQGFSHHLEWEVSKLTSLVARVEYIFRQCLKQLLVTASQVEHREVQQVLDDFDKGKHDYAVAMREWETTDRLRYLTEALLTGSPFYGHRLTRRWYLPDSQLPDRLLPLASHHPEFRRHIDQLLGPRGRRLPVSHQPSRIRSFAHRQTQPKPRTTNHHRSYNGRYDDSRSRSAGGYDPNVDKPDYYDYPETPDSDDDDNEYDSVWSSSLRRNSCPHPSHDGAVYLHDVSRLHHHLVQHDQDGNIHPSSVHHATYVNYYQPAHSDHGGYSGVPCSCHGAQGHNMKHTLYGDGSSHGNAHVVGSHIEMLPDGTSLHTHVLHPTHRVYSHSLDPHSPSAHGAVLAAPHVQNPLAAAYTARTGFHIPAFGTKSHAGHTLIGGVDLSTDHMGYQARVA